MDRAAIHEAGHALAAWAFDMPIWVVTTRKTEERDGATFVNASGFESPVTCAVIMVAGEIAEAIASGVRGGDRFDWLASDFAGATPRSRPRRFGRCSIRSGSPTPAW